MENLIERLAAAKKARDESVKNFSFTKPPTKEEQEAGIAAGKTYEALQEEGIMLLAKKLTRTNVDYAKHIGTTDSNMRYIREGKRPFKESYLKAVKKDLELQLHLIKYLF